MRLQLPLVAATLLLMAVGSLSCSREASPPKGERPIARPSTTPPTAAPSPPAPARTILPDGAPATWGLSAGPLPDGLNLGAASGQITGTPRKLGTRSVSPRTPKAASRGPRKAPSPPSSSSAPASRAP